MTPYHRTIDRTGERGDDGPRDNRPPEHLIRYHAATVAKLLGDPRPAANAGRPSPNRKPVTLTWPDGRTETHPCTQSAATALGCSSSVIGRNCRDGRKYRGIGMGYGKENK